MRIFLSYASEHSKIADTIAVSLRGRGHTVFLDKDDLPSGNGYELQIENAIKISDLVVFLISPKFLAPGRFTLTELALTKRFWPNPHYRVLPVVIEKTDMGNIPSYLKGVTLLEPMGNTAAEVALAVERLKKINTRQSTIGMALLGLIAVLFAPLWYHGIVRPVSQWLSTPAVREVGSLNIDWTGPYWFPHFWSWLPLGIAIGAGLSYWGNREYIKPAVSAAIITLGCSAAGIAAFIWLFQGKMDFPSSAALTRTEVIETDQISKDYQRYEVEREKRVEVRHSYMLHASGAAIFGGIAMLAVLAAGAVTHVPIRNPTRFLVGTGASALVAALSTSTTLAMGVPVEWSFPLWATASTGLLGYWIAG